ncbi:MAG: Crp/Fnr family transcriptional regulator [Tabrizicola sp.]|jgi:CRP-like cAMP-binding protein|nr:Crp/Fnr family transcriptional regulator [Tabrizicola sp.]
MPGTQEADPDGARHAVRFALLSDLSPQAHADFRKELSWLAVRPGQVVIEQGERSDQVYFVSSGRLLGQLVSENGREIAFTEIRAGSHFGELAALDGQPRSITVSAIDEAHLGRVGGAAFQRWLRAEPALALALARDLAARNRRLTERIFGLVAHDVEKRVRAFLTRMAQGVGELKPGGVLRSAPSHDEIATFVGANREAVSRVIARLAAEGVIESGRRRIVIQSVDALLDGI